MRSLVFAAAAAATVSAADAAEIGVFSDLVVFGDSLSDPGNVFLLTGGTIPDPRVYPEGQFTNGDTWASQLGADLESGRNFAFGGARARDNGDAVPDFGLQLENFASALGTGALTLGDNPLLTVWFGGNDLRDAATSADGAAIIGSAVTALVEGVSGLVSMGFRDILVIGAPDVGLTPEASEAGFSAAGSGATALFNGALTEQLALFSAVANVDYFDAAAVFNEIYLNYRDYGFIDRESACILTDGCLPSATDEFLFYDTIHPTERAHSLFADAVTASVPAVPLPASALMLLGGIAALLTRRSREAYQKS